MPSIFKVLENEDHALATERDEIIGRAESEKAAGNRTALFADGEQERLDAINDRRDQIRGELSTLGESRRLDRVSAAADDDEEGVITELGAYARGGDRRPMSQRFLEADEWQGYIDQIAGPSGQISLTTRVQSPKVEMNGLLPGPRPHALITGGGATSAGALVVPDQSGMFDEGALQRPLSILDIITRGTTDSDSVEFVRMTGFTNNAAPVPEADSTDPTDTTGLKPQSAIALERVSTTVKTIAHWEAATKRALADGGQIRTILDNFLRYGLQEELEDQIVAGSGAGENFTGLDNTSGVQAQAWDTDIFTTTRRARTKVRTVGRARATAYLLHPNDWEEFELALDNEGRFYSGGPFGTQDTPRLWRLPVVESEAVPEGKAWVGDFRKIVLWDRQQTTVEASDGVENFFLKNLVAILAEMRAAMGILRPSAFVEIDLTA